MSTANSCDLATHMLSLLAREVQNVTRWKHHVARECVRMLACGHTSAAVAFPQLDTQRCHGTLQRMWMSTSLNCYGSLATAQCLHAVRR